MNYKYPSLTALLCVMAISLFGCNKVEIEQPPADIMITHAKVVSPPNTVINNATIVIDGDSISYVGSGKINRKAKQTIDAQGRTVIPGLIDLHVHLLIGPDGEVNYQKEARESFPRRFEQFLQKGVTTVLSAGEYWPDFKYVKNLIKEKALVGPRLLVSGPIVTIPNGHPGDTIGCKPTPYCGEQWGLIFDGGEKEARQAIRNLADDNVDAIKIMYDGGYDNNFSPEILGAMIDEAHRRGLKVGVHAKPIQQAIEAIEQGADFLQHGPGLFRFGKGVDEDETLVNEFIAKVKQHNTPLVTTVSTLVPYNDFWGNTLLLSTGTLMKSFPDNVRGMIEKTYNYGYTDTRGFVDEGLMLAFGTDTWRITPAASIDGEIKALHDAKLTPEEILTIATYNAAAALGRDDLGEIAKGKLADLVFLAGDPLANIDALQRVDKVIKNGEIVFDFYKK